NRETDFFRDLRKLGRLPPWASNSRVANFRLALFERWVYRQCNAVIGLTAADLPPQRPNGINAVVPPVLEARTAGWGGNKSKNIFFVGNIAHYPNFLAIRWLCEEFAPALARLDPAAKIQILGVEIDSAPPEWSKQRNVELLGVGDRKQVHTCF